ncbi:hypothetical protein ACMFFK_20090 [Serratia marcescens]|uniref:hypothetical protein n=1 Tax=Serratia marcescens TaxID=615 RepID=UPI000666AD78|nr:hypothetical protein [Serratia marcescens]AVE48551.1 hypothetical protein AM354_02475 [Serratia marcescens]MBH2971902.1 hypothetical protein [Serratia marcescens]MBH2981250.1 hypothetical protein [Serratia marcescens]MBN3985562.1 hypothetical protein [Serratia marcescens]MBN5326700.1 hypothetical protein [Serratia marcescens]
MKLNKENERIVLSGHEAMDILSEVEFILISLRNIARHYYTDASGEVSQKVRNAYCEETTQFIDKNNVTGRLSKVRGVISEKFSHELGLDDMDDMDDIEREMEKIIYWEKPLTNDV